MKKRRYFYRTFFRIISPYKSFIYTKLKFNPIDIIRFLHMIFWGDKPFARLAIVLILGIVLGRYYPVYSVGLYLLCGGLFVLFLLSTLNKSRYREYWTGGLLLLFVLAGGYTRYCMMHPNMDSSHYSHQITASHMYASAKVLSIPKKTTRYSCFIQINAIGEKYDSLTNVTGKMTAYFKLEDSIASKYRPGDEIIFNGYVTKLRHSRNPNAFDFNDYLKTKHIFYRVDIGAGMHQATTKNLANPIERVANSIRSHALTTFDKYLENTDHRSLIGAMVLGFRNTINPELYASYTKTGAVHVLAVSGLHVGILCQILLLLLNKIFKSSDREKLIKLTILSLCTMTYVIITGASAAVMRASVMIIIYYIGKYWAERVNSYNVIAIAAFLLLIYDPYMIFQASFQFSFLALLSIIYFYRPIYEKLFQYYEIKSRLGNYVWQLIALSFSAQIFVAPLTVYYFHKFPFYFWLSGIVAVPAAYAILVLGILMIIFEYVAPFVNIIIDYIVTFIFDLFISAIQSIEQLPGSLWDNLWLHTHQLLLLYLYLILLLMGLHLSKANYIVNSLLVFMIFICSKYYYNSQSNVQSTITVYDNYKGHIIDFYDGKSCYNLSSEHLAKRTIEFVTNNNRVNKNITTVSDLNDSTLFEDVSFMKSENLIQFKGESILLLDSNFIKLDTTVNVDIAIILGGMRSTMKDIQTHVASELWVITQSEKQYKQNKWLEWCDQYGKNCVSIKEYGAYSIDISDRISNM